MLKEGRKMKFAFVRFETGAHYSVGRQKKLMRIWAQRPDGMSDAAIDFLFRVFKK